MKNWATYTFIGIKAAFFYHHFWNDDGSVDFGNEYDMVLSKAINDKVTVLAKYAYFDGGSTARLREIHRLTAQVEVKF